MNQSQESRDLAIAGKRDSSIMKGITVGTLTFLPGTAIAVSTLAMSSLVSDPDQRTIDDICYASLSLGRARRARYC